MSSTSTFNVLNNHFKPLCSSSLVLKALCDLALSHSRTAHFLSPSRPRFFSCKFSISFFLFSLKQSRWPDFVGFWSFFLLGKCCAFGEKLQKNSLADVSSILGEKGRNFEFGFLGYWLFLFIEQSIWFSFSDFLLWFGIFIENGWRNVLSFFFFFFCSVTFRVIHGGCEWSSQARVRCSRRRGN